MVRGPLTRGHLKVPVRGSPVNRSGAACETSGPRYRAPTGAASWSLVSIEVRRVTAR